MKNQFSKVSLEQFSKDYTATFGWMPEDDLTIREIYDEIKLPQRATRHSAGYDIFAPIFFCLKPGASITIPTGIRVELKKDRFLMCVPRSGLGFKFRLQLDNTTGVIDADYFEANNEGHIFAKLTNDGKENKIISIKQGDAFMQGIILRYDVVEDDAADGVRHGGLGSTTRR